LFTPFVLIPYRRRKIAFEPVCKFFLGKLMEHDPKANIMGNL